MVLWKPIRVLLSVPERVWNRCVRLWFLRLLSKYLAAANDEKFFVMVWAVDRLQSDYLPSHRVASELVKMPKQAITANALQTQFFIHKWKLENLINDLLVTPKRPLHRGNETGELNCANFNVLATVVNAQLAMENAESGIALERMSIFDEMARIGHQQFDWQRGFFNKPAYYRSAYIYGDPVCQKYFKETHGLTQNELSFVGFALSAQLMNNHFFARGESLDLIGIDNRVFEAALSRICVNADRARSIALDIRGTRGLRLYKKSILRQYPCIAFGDGGERIRAPLPALISERTTSGAYYDLVAAGGPVRNAIGRRFEQYCLDFLTHHLPTHSVSPSYQYKFRGQRVDAPDLFIATSGKLRVAMECKAKRMSFEARFSESPLTDAEEAFDEIAKGVFQLWKFFSHQRRFRINKDALSDETFGVVMTLEPWLAMTRGRYEELLARARKRAAADDAEIIDIDMRPVAICSIPDVEGVAAVATEGSLIAALRAAADAQFSSYLLIKLHERVAPDTKLSNGYAFSDKLAEVLPWWNVVQELAREKAARQ